MVDSYLSAWLSEVYVGKLDDEDQILARELGKVGATGGGLGGFFGGWLGAKALPGNVYEVSCVLDVPLATAMKRAYNALVTAGRVLEEDQASQSADTVRGIVKAGALNMNPAVVTITLRPIAPDRSGVHVRGVAKEGLIKQRAGEKAADRIVKLLS